MYTIVNIFKRSKLKMTHQQLMAIGLDMYNKYEEATGKKPTKTRQAEIKGGKRIVLEVYQYPGWFVRKYFAKSCADVCTGKIFRSKGLEALMGMQGLVRDAGEKELAKYKKGEMYDRDMLKNTIFDEVNRRVGIAFRRKRKNQIIYNQR